MFFKYFKKGNGGITGGERTKPKAKTLYMLAEQDIYVSLCIAIYRLKAPIELLGDLHGHNISLLKQAVARLSPDVVLISLKDLKGDTVTELEQIRTDHPNMGLVLLLEVCSARDIEQLRRLSMLKSEGGTAIILKQSLKLDRIEWLCMVVSAVSQGQLIFDKFLTAFMFAGKPGYTFLKQFNLMELEILNLMSNGYTNLSIAADLYTDIKTVEHYINDIYSKLKIDKELTDKNLRASAVKLYLEATRDSREEGHLITHGPVNQL